MKRYLWWSDVGTELMSILFSSILVFHLDKDTIFAFILNTVFSLLNLAISAYELNEVKELEELVEQLPDY